MRFGSDEYWLGMAARSALASKDESTQNGAVLVAANGGFTTGYNCFVDGVNRSPDRLGRPEKHVFTEHAERSCIYNAAKVGLATKNSTLYCLWYACADCGRAIIASGVRRVVGLRACFDAGGIHWRESIAAAFTMFDEAGIQTDVLDADVGVTLRFNGTAVLL